MKTLSVLPAILLLLSGAAARADAPSVHGMVVFGGKGATYASHLPMFHAPHDRQVILKIALNEFRRNHVLASYAAAQAAGRALFTLEPEVMDLAKIADGTTASFVASLYDGHFERGGTDLGKVRVTVEKVVFSSKLDPSAPQEKKARYLVFGQGGQYFAAHLIQGKPSFDAIIEVSQPYELKVPSCRTRVCGDPVRLPIEDAALPLQLAGPGDARLLQAGPVPPASPIVLGSPFEEIADGKTVVYVEEGDLSH